MVALSTAGIVTPNFVLAPLLQLLFGFGLKGVFDWLGWQTLPIGGWDDGNWRNTVLPIIVLAVPQFAIISRLMRASMIEALRSHHVRTARSMGLPGSTVIIRHTLRGALLPVISYLGPQRRMSSPARSSSNGSFPSPASVATSSKVRSTATTRW